MLRFPRLRSLFVVAPVILATALAGCSGSSKSATKPEAQGTTTTSTVAKLKVGTVSVQTAGPNVQLNAATQRAVLQAAQQYYDAAVTGPLRTGAVAPAYAALFDPRVRTAATTTDKAALTNVAIGKAKDGYRLTLGPVRVDALADQNGKLLFVATSMASTASTTTARGPVTLRRSTELTFAPVFGKWLVTAYRSVAIQNSAAGTTTTTAHSPTTAKP